MAEIRDRMERRHVREKTVIDHLAEKLFDPTASADDGHTAQKSTTPPGSQSRAKFARSGTLARVASRPFGESRGVPQRQLPRIGSFRI
jgi:hypothetical protein